MEEAQMWTWKVDVGSLCSDLGVPQFKSTEIWRLSVVTWRPEKGWSG